MKKAKAASPSGKPRSRRVSSARQATSRKSRASRSKQFEEIYLVSQRIFPVNQADIDKLEKAIGSLPNGYREFMLRCGGQGSLMEDIFIWPPRLILDQVHENREWMTLSSCAGSAKDLQGLEERDFEDIWVFGSDGVGSKYCYFPRHTGALFDLTHGGMKVVRHERAFCQVSAFWCSGYVRHPYPFFEPIEQGVKNARCLQSFHVTTSLDPSVLGKAAVAYWDRQGCEAILIKMPRQSDDDLTKHAIVLIPSIGGKMDIVCDVYNTPDEVHGSITCDKLHRTAARTCVAGLLATATSSSVKR